MRTFIAIGVLVSTLLLSTITPTNAWAVPKHHNGPKGIQIFLGQPQIPRPHFHPQPHHDSNQVSYLAQNLEQAAFHLSNELNSLGDNNGGWHNNGWSNHGFYGGGHGGELNTIRSLVSRFSYTASEFRNSVDRRNRGYNHPAQLLRTLNNLASDITWQFNRCGNSLRHAQRDWINARNILYRINSVYGSGHHGPDYDHNW